MNFDLKKNITNFNRKTFAWDRSEFWRFEQVSFKPKLGRQGKKILLAVFSCSSERH
jgi:hypothetical protein